MAIIRTVLGDVDPATIGAMLPHEHVIQDHFPVWGDADLTLKDEREMTHELVLAKADGVTAIADLSTIDTYHDLEALARVSTASKMHVIGSTGWFYGQHHPPDVVHGTVSKLVDIMLRDVLDGSGSGRARAGVIGEIGTSANEMHDSERKVFLAAAEVHRQTGVPIYTHTTDGTHGPEQVDFFTKLNVPPSRIAVSHMDTNRSYDYHLAVASRGAYLSFDRISNPEDMTDEERVEMIVRLVDAGYVRQILLSLDTGRRSTLATRGGRGYSYVAKTFIPRLRAAGLGQALIETMTVENPRAYYAFSPPGARA